MTNIIKLSMIVIAGFLLYECFILDIIADRTDLSTQCSEIYNSWSGLKRRQQRLILQLHADLQSKYLTENFGSGKPG